MGGYGSTRWRYHNKKRTVRECSTINLQDMSKVLLARRFEADEPVHYDDQGSVKYADLMVNLVRRTAGIEETRTPPGQGIALIRTACRYGGWRYWLVCPDCGRRCLIVYRPGGYGLSGFACRECHHLTYESAQEAHRYDRLSGPLGSFARRMDVVTRAELVRRKLETMRPGSKNYQRTVRRAFDILSKG